MVPLQEAIPSDGISSFEIGSASNIPMGTSRKAKTIGDHGHKEPGDGKRDAQRTSTIQY